MPGRVRLQAYWESWILLASESVSTSVSPTLVHQDSVPVTSFSRLSISQYRLPSGNGFAAFSDTAKVLIAAGHLFVVANRICKTVCARAMNEWRMITAEMANILMCARSHAGILQTGSVQNRAGLLLMHSGKFAVSGLKKGKVFFRARVTEYQTDGALSWIGFDDKGCFCSLCCKGFSHVAVWRVGGVVVV